MTIAADIETPKLEPGLYEQVPEAEYHAWPLCSYSRLKTLIQETPAVCHEQMQTPTVATPDMILGSAVDCATLTPRDFESRFVVPDFCNAILSSGARKGEECRNPGKVIVDGDWRCGSHGKGGLPDGREEISDEDMGRCTAMRDAILRHPKAGKLIRATGDHQLSAIFREETTGVFCKLRVDKYIPALRMVIDIKKTRAGFARPDRWQREMVRRGYHFQAVMYPRGLKALGLAVEHFCHVVVEDEPPFQVAVYRLFPDEATEGKIWSRLIGGMRTYAACCKSGVWPAYSDDIEDLGLTGWDEKQIEEPI